MAYKFLHKAFTDEESVKIICALVASPVLMEDMPKFMCRGDEDEMLEYKLTLSSFADALRRLHFELTRPPSPAGVAAEPENESD